MRRRVNFIRADSGYKSAVSSIVYPVAKELVKFGVDVSVDTVEHGDEDVNVYSFFNEGYLERIGGLKGVSVHLAHGVADKDYRTANAMRKFDYCVAEGQFCVDKLRREGYPANKILVGGFPKFSVLSEIADEYRMGIRQRGSDGVRKIVVLYAPTHSGVEGNLCSLAHHKNGDVVKKLEDERFEIVSSVHPYNEGDNKCTLDKVVCSDVVVSDCSSLIYEAWHLGKPVVFLDDLVKEHICKYYPKSCEAEIYNSNIGRHAENYTHAKKLILEAWAKGITEDEQFMLDMVSNAELRRSSPRILARQLAKLGGYEV